MANGHYSNSIAKEYGFLFFDKEKSGKRKIAQGGTAVFDKCGNEATYQTNVFW